MSHDDAKKEIKPTNDVNAINAKAFLDRMPADARQRFLFECVEVFLPQYKLVFDEVN
jgi:hypothetical protein